MSNASLPLVNRELAYARMQLQLLDSVPPQAPDRALQRKALCSAALLQLSEALRFYWREIAANYGLRERPATLEGLRSALEVASLDAAEARELQILRDTDGSWLANLGQWIEQREAENGAGGGAAAPVGSASAQIITAVELGHTPPDLTAEHLRQCLDGMQALLQRQRSGMTEY